MTLQPIDALETGSADLGAGDHTYLITFIGLVPQSLSYGWLTVTGNFKVHFPTGIFTQ